MTRFYLCGCGAPHQDTSLCIACGRRRERIRIPKLRGRIYEQDADGVETLIYDSDDVGQLELM